MTHRRIRTVKQRAMSEARVSTSEASQKHLSFPTALITRVPHAQFRLNFKHMGAWLDLSFAGSRGEYNSMWCCPRPGLNPSGLVNNSSLAAGPQFTEVKIL